ADLVVTHQAAIADDVRGHDRSEPSFDATFAHAITPSARPSPANSRRPMPALQGFGKHRNRPGKGRKGRRSRRQPADCSRPPRAPLLRRAEPTMAQTTKEQVANLPPYGNGTLPAGIRSCLVEGVNGMAVHMLESGFEAKSRPAVLLLHGFPELAYSWR